MNKQGTHKGQKIRMKLKKLVATAEALGMPQTWLYYNEHA
jgi:hypothetical protein